MVYSPKLYISSVSVSQFVMFRICMTFDPYTGSGIAVELSCSRRPSPSVSSVPSMTLAMWTLTFPWRGQTWMKCGLHLCCEFGGVHCPYADVHCPCAGVVRYPCAGGGHCPYTSVVHWKFLRQRVSADVKDQCRNPSIWTVNTPSIWPVTICCHCYFMFTLLTGEKWFCVRCCV